MNTVYTYEQLLNKREHIHNNSEEFWDARAESFASAQKKQTSEIPKKVIEFLKNKGLLNENATILDIGGGSGRYAIPMARHSKKVVLTDISSNMLNYAKEIAEEEGIKNIDYMKFNLKETPVEDMGWYKEFDLVFSSMCPAIKGKGALDQLIAASKGSCYIGQYIQMEDSISKVIMKVLEISNNNDPHNDRDAAYAIFNILWLKGYEPEVTYIKEATEEIYSLEEVKNMYEQRYSKIAKEKGKDLDAILLSISKDGKVVVKKENTMALILWKA